MTTLIKEIKVGNGDMNYYRVLTTNFLVWAELVSIRLKLFVGAQLYTTTFFLGKRMDQNPDWREYIINIMYT